MKKYSASRSVRRRLQSRWALSLILASLAASVFLINNDPPVYRTSARGSNKVFIEAFGGVAAQPDVGVEYALPPDTPVPSPDPSPMPTQTNEADASERSPSVPLNIADPQFAAERSWGADFRRLESGSISSIGWRADLNPAVPGWNSEAQGYTDHEKNVRLESGTGLILEAHKENYSYENDDQTYEYTSARIDTRDSFSFEYGKLEARIKMPDGVGVWPAFWLLSSNQRYTSEFNPTEETWGQDRFYLHDGEIDIVEYYGIWPGHVEGSFHTFNDSTSGVAMVDPTNAFHTYAIEISPNRISWLLDGVEYYAVDKPSSDPDDWPIGGGNEFYVLLNLALGGSGGGAVIEDASGPWQMVVEEVAFYEYIGA